MKRIITIILALVAFASGMKVMAADESYAVYNSGALLFYHDSQRSSKTGTTYPTEKWEVRTERYDYLQELALGLVPGCNHISHFSLISKLVVPNRWIDLRIELVGLTVVHIVEFVVLLVVHLFCSIHSSSSLGLRLRCPFWWWLQGAAAILWQI